MESMEITGIIKALEIFDGKYKRKEIDEAVKRKEEITPYLIDILKKVSDEPWCYVDTKDNESNYWGHIYAVMLLSHFRESSAHDLIVELFSLPGEMSHDLFGDIVTEDLPAILYSTCGGSLERIKEMILNKVADEFCRSAALRAMVYAVVDGIVPRDEVIRFFASLFPSGKVDEEDKDDELYTQLANAVCDIYPEELMDKIKKAYEQDLIDPFSIELDDFEYALGLGKEGALGMVKKDMERRLSENIHENISWWACFNEETLINEESYVDEEPGYGEEPEYKEETFPDISKPTPTSPLKRPKMTIPSKKKKKKRKK
jgi:hypothetical protein